MREVEFDFSGAGQVKEQLEVLTGHMKKEVLAEMEEFIQGGSDAWDSVSGNQLRKIMTEEKTKEIVHERTY